MIRCKGFTLIELIVVILLVAVLAAGAGLLIARPIEAYTDQIRRQQLVDSAEMALRKIAVDVRRALPNSIRVVDNSPNGWALEMVNTVDGARYRDEFGGGFIATTDILEFIAGETEFNLLGQLTAIPITSLPQAYSHRLVIYNTSPSEVYGDAQNTTETSGIISDPGFTLSLTGNEHHIQLTNAYQFEYSSPTQRLFVVDGPISYICDDSGSLTRIENYPYRASQTDVDNLGDAAFTGANIGRVASQVSRCEIDYQPGTAQRGGLISLELTLSDSENESVQLLHQIHVDNVP